MTVLIKLGGSLITDKRRARHFRRSAVQAVAVQLREIRRRRPDLPLVVGHGSGSFGHFEAARHNTAQGVRSPIDWQGFAQVGAAATELSHLVLRELLDAGLPAFRIQPSSLLLARAGHVASFDAALVSLALERGLLPLLHGDVALDEEIGGTIISTEAIFCELVEPLDARRIILLGDAPGVLDSAGKLVPVVTPSVLPRLAFALGGSGGVDVTGGMLQKVRVMAGLARRYPGLRAHIVDGAQENALVDILLRQRPIGTVIRAD